MLKLIIFLLILLCFKTSCSIANLVLVDVKNNAKDFQLLDIQTIFRGSNSGLTAISTLDNSLHSKLTEQDNINSIALASRDQYFIIKGDQYFIKHKPDQLIELQYSIYNTDYGNNFKYFRSSAALVLPKEDHYKYSFQLLQNQSIILPHKLLSTSSNSILDKREIKLSFFVSGDYERQRLMFKNKLFSNIKLSAAFKKKINKIISIQNKMFSLAPGAYNIWLINNKHEPDIKGEAKQKLILIKGAIAEDNDELYRVIAHELMHRFIGHLLRQNHAEIQYKWFFEGFTEFLGIKSLVNSQLVEKEQYLKIINSTLKEYFNSPLNTLNFGKITKGHLVDKQIELLNYNKGFIIALIIDQALIDNTTTINLENIVEDIILASKDNIFRIELYREVLKRYFNETFVTEILTAVDNPDILERFLPNKLHDTSLQFYPEKIYSFCFNLPRALEQKRIQGIDQKNECYKIGLRNDQLLKSYSIDYNSGLVRLGVQERSDFKYFTFQLTKKRIFVPTFR